MLGEEVMRFGFEDAWWAEMQAGFFVAFSVEDLGSNKGDAY